LIQILEFSNNLGADANWRNRTAKNRNHYDERIHRWTSLFIGPAKMLLSPINRLIWIKYAKSKSALLAKVDIGD
ncbi:MAG: hypothetical protein WCC54_20665, partial [Pseudolabrys sp.]